MERSRLRIALTLGERPQALRCCTRLRRFAHGCTHLRFSAFNHQPFLEYILDSGDLLWFDTRTHLKATVSGTLDGGFGCRGERCRASIPCTSARRQCSKIIKLYHSIRGAPAKLEEVASGLWTIELHLHQLDNYRRACKSWGCSNEEDLLLDLLVKRCAKPVAQLANVTRKLESRMSRSSFVGKLSVPFYEPYIQELLEMVEREKLSLLLVCHLQSSVAIQSRLEEQQQAIAAFKDNVALRAQAMGKFHYMTMTGAITPCPAPVSGLASSQAPVGTERNWRRAGPAQAYVRSLHPPSNLELHVADDEAAIKKPSKPPEGTFVEGKTLRQSFQATSNATSTLLLQNGHKNISTYTQGVGTRYCGCTCHVATILSFYFFGHIHFERRPSPPCRQSTCRKSCAGTSAVTSLTWVAPACSPVQRMVSVALYSSRHMNLNFSLVSPRIVASDSMIFHFATIGNLPGIQWLLENGLASPDDIKRDGGFTPLHYAIQAGSFEVYNFLLRAHGKPDLQTGASMTALDLIMTKILICSADAETLAALAQLFDVRDFIESRQFSPVHKPVLGLRSNSVAEILKENMACIDAYDSKGRTPISWAAEMGHYEALSTLIDHFANIQLADHGCMTPMHYAATSSSLECLTLLLDAGADACVKDKDRGWTPSHYAAFNQIDPVWVEKLLAHHVDVNVTTDNLKTPLTLALMARRAAVAETLIKHGARCDVKGADGFTPLNATIISNSSACMQVMLSAGVDLGEVAWKGQTMLHLIGQFADEEMMDCLMQVDLACLDPQMRDEAGRSAQELCRSKNPPAPRPVAVAFAKLCTRIRKDRNARGG